MHCSWMFHLCNTLPHPCSSTIGGLSRFPQGYATPTTVLLLSCSLQVLLLSCIPRHHPSTLCSSPTSPHFCVNPASVECYSLPTSGAMALFSCKVDALLIKLAGYRHSDAMLCYLHVHVKMYHQVFVLCESHTCLAVCPVFQLFIIMRIVNEFVH